MLLCFPQERAAAKATQKEGELAAALSEKDAQIIYFRNTVDTSEAAAEKMLVPALFPFLPAEVTIVEAEFEDSLKYVFSCDSALLVCLAIAALIHQYGHEIALPSSATNVWQCIHIW